MAPATAPYARLTYKSAAASARAASDLGVSLPSAPSRRAPPPRRHTTHRTTAVPDDPAFDAFAQRTMSLSCIPPSAACQTDHVCARCVAPPPSPPPSTPPLAPVPPPPRPTRLFRPISPDLPPTPVHLDGPPSARRTRSAYKPPPLPYRAFGSRARTRGPRSPRQHASLPVPTRRERVSSALPAAPSRQTPARAVYNATTASARAAELATTKGRGGFQVEPSRTDVRDNELRDQLPIVPPSRADPSGARVVADKVHRRLSDHTRARAAEKMKQKSVDQQRASASEKPRHKSADQPRVRAAPENVMMNTADQLCPIAAREKGPRKAGEESTPPKIVVRRRLIRGSSVFRLATEEDIEELLQGERYREMVRVPSAGVNVPPVVPNSFPSSPAEMLEGPDRELSMQCAGQLLTMKRAPSMPMRGMRRVSSLLSRHLGLDGDSENTLDIAEMAAMDDYSAVTAFLKEIRRYRKEVVMSMQDKVMERAAERGATNGRKKDVRKAGKERKTARDMEKLHRKVWQQRSLSADDPSLMRALLQQEHLLNTHATNRKHRIRPELKRELEHEKAEDDFEEFRERSQSELVSRFGLKEAEMDERWKRVMSTFTRVDDTCESPKAEDEPELKKEDDETQKGAEPTPPERRITTFDDDEYPPHLRILTAIEPVDPTMGLDDMDARRGTSYHMGTDGTLGVAGSRRRGMAGLRGIHVTAGDTGLLRRLRSMRRRPEERY